MKFILIIVVSLFYTNFLLAEKIYKYEGGKKCELNRSKSQKNRYSKFDSIGANGSCVETIKPSDGQRIASVLKKTSSKTMRADAKGNKLRKKLSEGEDHAFAEVLNTISSISNNSSKLHHKITAKYSDFMYKPIYVNGVFTDYAKNKDGTYKKKNSATCSGRTLRLNRTGDGRRELKGERAKFKTGRNNTIHIAHELGHCFGHKRIPYNENDLEKFDYNKIVNYVERLSKKGKDKIKNEGIRLYDLYNIHVEKKCFTSWYSSCHYTKYKLRNEEFADSMAYYIANPDVLQNPDSLKNIGQVKDSNLFQNTKNCQSAIKFFSTLFNEKVPVTEITCSNRMKKVNSVPAKKAPYGSTK